MQPALATHSHTRTADPRNERVFIKRTMAELNSNWIKSGDRSHPNLQLVDSLKSQLTYEGHDSDLERLEKAHLSGSSLWLPSFEDLLFYVRESQRIHEGDISHPRLVPLDALELTYDGWEEDFGSALVLHKEKEDDILKKVECAIESMKRKEAMFHGDRSKTRNAAQSATKEAS